jgi:hypothetical protein
VRDIFLFIRSSTIDCGRRDAPSDLDAGLGRWLVHT